MPEIDARAVDTLFRAYSGAVPGASVIVIRDGEVLLRRAYGLADLESRLPAAPTTDFRLASLSKQFTAMAIMLLVRDGKLRYDQPVSGLLPELPAAARTITIRHLLNHTSGVWDYEDLIPETRTAQLDDHDVLALVAAKDSVYFPAGSAYRYSNSGYVLLGIIVARASGMPFPEFVRRRIFDPSGMTATVASHPRAIHVASNGGIVALTGDVLASEVATIVAHVNGVRGVREVRNRMMPHAAANGIPALQGYSQRPGWWSTWMRSGWSPTAIAATGAGAAAMAVAIARR